MPVEKAGNAAKEGFDVVFGIDMETDIGSFTPYYEGVKHGTYNLLSIMERNGVKATYFWTGHAAEHNPGVIADTRDAGHEIGSHGLYHETLGDPIFPLPNNWPVLASEVEGRIAEGGRLVEKHSGVQPLSFRCPRLWGSTAVVNALEKMGYLADASLPLYFYTHLPFPYHPSEEDWTKEGTLKILEIPNFCDLSMESSDEYGRDRDQWPIFRTESAEALMGKIDSFIDHVSGPGGRPVLCFYFHPWEFHPMPEGPLDFGEARVIPEKFIVKNCGDYACEQFEILCRNLKNKGGRFVTCEEMAVEYR